MQIARRKNWAQKWAQIFGLFFFRECWKLHLFFRDQKVEKMNDFFLPVAPGFFVCFQGGVGMLLLILNSYLENIFFKFLMSFKCLLTNNNKHEFWLGCFNHFCFKRETEKKSAFFVKCENKKKINKVNPKKERNKIRNFKLHKDFFLFFF